jgi:dipeptidyl-peptidase-4
MELVAKTLYGLEEILAKELIELGANDVQIGRRMVSFSGDQELLYKTNYHCRTALRILKPILTFQAKNPDDIYTKIKEINWLKYLPVKKTFAVDAVVYSETFTHSKFITYRVKDAIVDWFAEKELPRPSVRLNNPDIQLHIHISHAECTISLDSSGESLHKRGYRIEETEAPLNEVLAAGMILKTGWKGESNFVDPMCGSGTLLIEAVLIALNIAPGIFRNHYAFEKWDDFDAELFEQISTDDTHERTFEFKAYGSDSSPKAIQIAAKNMKNAGLSKYIGLQVLPLQEMKEAPEKGILITNPPYGERMNQQDLMQLYSTIGERLKHVFTGYDAWIISSNREGFEQIGLKPAAKYKLFNGALDCEYRQYKVFSGKHKVFKQAICLLFLISSFILNLSAQQKQFTLEELIPGGVHYAQLQPKTRQNVKWEGDSLIYFDKEEPKKDIKESRTGDYFLSLSQAEGLNKQVVYGQAVHRNEFGIKGGTFPSPDGHYLAFYRMDESMVGDYPLVDISDREARLKSIKYPMAGMKSHEVTVGIHTRQPDTTFYLQTGEPKDHYLTNVSWDPSEKYIYIAEVNREQNHLQLNKYSVETGEKTATLFEERNDRYVEPEHPLLFLKKSPNQFIWQSKRDGYNRLYLYNTDGKLIKQLTSGKGDVTEVLGLDAGEQHVFFVSNEANPIECQAYKVHLKTGKKTQLTVEPGVHRLQLSESGQYLIDRYSNLTTPLNIDLINTANGKIQRLQTAENPCSEYTLPEITLGSLKAADGTTDLYYRLVKPVNFQPDQKYPVVVYVYGGPHSQMVVNSWLGGVRGWDIYMAQKGYVIFTLDNRGTSNRGFDFESIIHRQLGIHETADQMRGIEFLQSLPYVDAGRIGVHGWSYGGFMTANLLLQHPEIFKVGVAGGPVIDWKYYEVMYGERYMDTPEENPEGYEQSNINRLAGNLQGHFLVIHGDEDNTVVWQNSLSFLKACITAGTYPDYFVYPGQEHNMRGRDRIHLHEKITRYFDDYLK